MMQEYFHALADRLTHSIESDEVLTCRFNAEESDFVRFNHNRVRQAGTVAQRSMSLNLIAGQRHSMGRCDLTGNLEHDIWQLSDLMHELRAQRVHLPDDPYLNYATEVHDSTHVHDNMLPDSAQVINHLMEVADGLDLVGIWASGPIHTAFANSLGQRNWHSSATFNFDWSCYYAKDKAVKSGYAGSTWEPALLEAKIDETRRQLDVMSKPPKSITPGQYRAYLSPPALKEILEVVAWGGFSLKSHRTAQTPLLKMVREGKRLHQAVSLEQDLTAGLGPNFTDSGFIVPERVALIEYGNYRNCLASPRSAREYNTTPNSGSEFPSSLRMAPGTLNSSDIFDRLDTGVYINNLWYCNFSDRNNCQITGMTRFACFWVENGRIHAPLNVMRFDDSVYRILGDQLLALTQDSELILDPSTYDHRSTDSCRLPGALLGALKFTL
jgi:predicted Zn-dependent protease